jgi:hypothetical protein
MALRRIAIVALAVLMALGYLSAGCGAGGVGGRDIAVEGPTKITRTFEVGDVYKYKFKIESVIGVMQTGFERSITRQAEFRTTTTVTGVSEESVDASLQFDYSVGAMATGDAMLQDESVSALRGKQLLLKLDPDGQFQSASGMANESAFESGAGEYAMAISEVFPKLPEEPLQIGTTWTEPVDIPDPNREFVGETVYEVVGFKEKYAIQCVEIISSTDFEFEGRASQGDDVWLMTGSGSGTGRMLVSIEDGNVVYSSSEATLTLIAEGASVASAAASGVVNMGVTTNSVIEIL